MLAVLFAAVDLAARFTQEVDRRLDVPVEEQAMYADLLAAAAVDALFDEPPQYVLLVDRCPNVQAAMLFWMSAEGRFHWIGASPVSTGKPGRFEYFETPTGVFAHTIANRDFRALGTRNAFGIRGYGVKGMRVYDFGWVKSPKGWGDRKESVLRLQMHSTDPELLEPKLGAPMSKGCIRIPASLNRFLDRYGLLDADYEAEIAQGKRPATVLLAEREPVPWAGRYLVVVDSLRAAKPF